MVKLMCVCPGVVQMHVKIEKNPELGFSISGGVGGRGNPFRPDDNVRLSCLCLTGSLVTVSYRNIGTFKMNGKDCLYQT